MPPHYRLLGLFFLVALHGPASRCYAATANGGTLTAGQAVDKLVSRNAKFVLGFFTSGSSTATSKSSSPDNTSTTTPNWYLGIWFNKIPDFTPVWIANRDEPITDPAGLKFQISRDGNLVVLDHTGAAGTPVWSTEISNAASKNSNNTIVVAVLTDKGNLVIGNASEPSQQVLWQSFDYPTDVFLPGSKLGRNKVTGLNRVFISKKNRINPGHGSYCVGVDSRFSQGIILSLCSSSVVYWASGTFSQQNVDPSDSGLTSYNHVDNNQEQYFIYSTPNDESLSIYTVVEISGQMKARVWNESLQSWHQFYTQPMDPCSVQAACGPFTICTNNNANLLCDCMKGFSVKLPGEWDLEDRAGGCMRNNPLDCTTDKFLPVPGVTLAYNPMTMQGVADASGCAQACANDCTCTAYSYTSTGCSIWNGELLNTAMSTTAGGILYLRLAAKDYLDIFREKKRRPSIGVVTVVSIAGSGIILVLILVILFIIWRRNQEYGLPSSNTQDCVGIRTFRYSYLRYATKKFSERLGGGGFGSVYKGLLRDSAITIAVKRLDGARQGEKQFRAEVSSIGLIQHINLVKLIGFCCESDKRLLVYEYMSNGSLDVHLFNNNDIVLDWSTRYQIAAGVARGLSYLHEGCRECIIHCDIKPDSVTSEANVLSVPFHGHVDGRPKAGPSVGSLTQLIDSRKTIVGSDEFATLAAPMLAHDVDALLNDFSFQGPSGDFCSTLKPCDPVEEFLNETIADPDEHSSSTSKLQYDSDTGMISNEFDNNWVMQGDLLDDSNWFDNFVPDEANPQLSGLYENAALLPYDSTNPDVLSMDSADESLQDLFNSMEDTGGKRDVYEPGFNGMHQQLQSNIHPNYLWSNERGLSAMHQQLQSTMQPNYVISQQGIAPRRLKLCGSLSAVNVESRESITRDELEESDIVTSKYMGGSVESTADVDDAESTGVTIMSRCRATSVPSDGDDAESTGVTIMSWRPAPSSNVQSDRDEAESTGVTNMNGHPAPSAYVPSDGDDDDASTGVYIISQDTLSSSNTDSSVTQQGMAVQRLRLQSNLNAGPRSSVDDSSSCIIDENGSDKSVNAEIEEHVETNFSDKVSSVGNNQADAQTDIPDHDVAMLVLDANSVMRQRKTMEKSDKENKQEYGLQSHVRAPRKRGGFPAHIIWPVLSVALLVLVSVGMYGWA